MNNSDDVDEFASEHLNRKQNGANKRRNRKGNRDGERRMRPVGRKERWHFDRTRSYDEED